MQKTVHLNVYQPVQCSQLREKKNTFRSFKTYCSLKDIYGFSVEGDTIPSQTYMHTLHIHLDTNNTVEGYLRTVGSGCPGSLIQVFEVGRK